MDEAAAALFKTGVRTEPRLGISTRERKWPTRRARAAARTSATATARSSATACASAASRFAPTCRSRRFARVCLVESFSAAAHGGRQANPGKQRPTPKPQIDAKPHDWGGLCKRRTKWKLLEIGSVHCSADGSSWHKPASAEETTAQASQQPSGRFEAQLVPALTRQTFSKQRLLQLWISMPQPGFEKS
jgi:hypothetical protein